MVFSDFIIQRTLLWQVIEASSIPLIGERNGSLSGSARYLATDDYEKRSILAVNRPY
jgi:hypothetical protein